MPQALQQAREAAAATSITLGDGVTLGGYAAALAWLVNPSRNPLLPLGAIAANWTDRAVAPRDAPMLRDGTVGTIGDGAVTILALGRAGAHPLLAASVVAARVLLKSYGYGHAASFVRDAALLAAVAHQYDPQRQR